MKASISVQVDPASTGGPGSLLARPRNLAARLWVQATVALSSVISFSTKALDRAQVKVSAMVSTGTEQVHSTVEGVRSRSAKTAQVLVGKVVVTKTVVQTRVLNIRAAGSSLLASSTSKLVGVALRAKEVALSYVPLSVKFRLSRSYATIVAKFTSTYDATTHTHLGATLVKFVDAIRSHCSAAATAVKSTAYGIALRAQETGLSYVPAPVKRRSFALFKYIASKAAAAKAYSSEKIAFVQQSAHTTAEMVKNRAANAKAYIAKVASQPKVQTSAKSAVGGAVALGVAGGATGLTTGAALGAAVGLVPAIFTLGLSIPIGAAIGGGTGMLVGSAIGGATGFVGGGVVGLKKDEIKTGASNMIIKANGCGEYVMDTAKSSKEYIKVQANVARARIVCTTAATAATAA